MNDKLVQTINITTLMRFINNRSTMQIARPMEIGSFGYDDDNNIYDPVQNRYVRPNLPCNIVDGFNQDIHMTTSNGESPLTPVLQTLMKNNIDVCASDFITYRNNLNKIFGSYQNKDKAWSMHIERLHNTVHLGIIMEKEETYDSVEFAKSVYSGRKFEELSTTKDTANKYCTIVDTILDHKRIILAAEIDCYENVHINNNNYQNNNNNNNNQTHREYIELKTYRMITNEKINHTFTKFKTFNFWLQSYLAGVSKIVCGFRDDSFQVQEIREYNTHQLPHMGQRFWNPSECLEWGNRILNFIKHTTLPNIVYRLDYQYPDIRLYEVNNSTNCDFVLDDNYRAYFYMQKEKKK